MTKMTQHIIHQPETLTDTATSDTAISGTATSNQQQPIKELVSNQQARAMPDTLEDKVLQQAMQRLEHHVVNLVSCAIHEDKPLYLGNARCDQAEELDVLDELLRDYGFMLVWRKIKGSRNQEVPVFLEPVSLPKTVRYEGARVYEVRHGVMTAVPQAHIAESSAPPTTASTPETFD